ncbi:uncharacterized protein LOC6725691 isoform X2 [Drosophila simulans]|uniref:uncharacterized protein LOC6725691 isoform X2 n=1 Tax=Drosophila simulans TaxID=7240 RepID=UPI00192D148C|nr:uncharacterized protein LOC6725691 isoform X2 [Drosophila simulans]
MDKPGPSKPRNKKPLAEYSTSPTNSSSDTDDDNGNVDSVVGSSTAAGRTSGVNSTGGAIGAIDGKGAIGAIDGKGAIGAIDGKGAIGAIDGKGAIGAIDGKGAIGAIDGKGSIGKQSAGIGRNIIYGDLPVSNDTALNLSVHRDSSNTEQDKKSTMIMTPRPFRERRPCELRRRRSPRPRFRQYMRSSRELEACDLGLMGWTGEFPKLTPISNIESNSDKNPLQQQQQQQSLTTPIMTSQLDATGGELDEAIKKPLNTNNNPNAIGTATTSSSSTTATNMQPSDLNNQVEVNKKDTSHKSLIETKDAMSARIMKRSMSTHESPPMQSRCSVRFSSHTPLADETNKMKETSTDTSFKVIYARLKQTGVERDLFIPSTGNPRTRTNGIPAPKVAEIEHVPVVKDKTVAKEEAVVKGKEGLANPSSVMPQTPTLAVTGKRVSKPKVPKGASPPSEGWTSTMAVKGNSRADAASYNNSSSCSSPIGNTNIRRRRAHAKAAPKKSKPCANCTASVHPSGPKLCKKCIYAKGFAKKRWLDKAAGNDRHRDDDDYDSDFSMVEVTVEDEISVPQAEKKQLENVVQQTATKEQEVVVIGGRKAVAIKADPIGCNMKVIPKQINLTGLKTISTDNASSSLVQSLTDSHVGCQIVMAVMKIMTMKERVTMAQVCKTWSMISQDKSVWRTVTLRHTHISNWPCFIRELAKNDTRELDMRGTFLPSPVILASLDLSVLKSLRVLRTCPVDDQFLYAIFRNLPQLLELRAICCSPTYSFSNLEHKCAELRVLEILMTDHRSKVESLDSLGNLLHLTELNIRGVNYIGSQDFSFLKKLLKLKVLVLSSCQGMNTKEFGQKVLPYLKSLRRLRLENKHMVNTFFPLYHILGGVASGGTVNQLELVNVEVDDLLTSLIGMCTTVTDLLLVPKCLQNSANVIYSVMRAVRENASQLRVFRLGLVTQLLSATGELYKGSKKDVIPVQRPVPGVPNDDDLNYCAPDDCCTEKDHTECVTFLPAKRLLMILRDVAPTTFVTFVKVNMFNSTMVTFLKPTNNS